MTHLQHETHGHTTEPADLNRLAASATNHCLTGCVIGEVLGMVIATALGWGDAASIALAVFATPILRNQPQAKRALRGEKNSTPRNR